jgi:thiamine biosynthesis lipoprotein
VTARREAALQRGRPLMGTLVRVRASGGDAAARRRGVARALAVLARIEGLMSFHDPRSELSRLNACAHRRPMRVSRDTYAVLRLVRRLARASEGRFDPAVAPVLIRFGFLPGVAQVSGASSARDLRLLSERRVAYRQPMQLDLGGIAKGYAVDCAVEALLRAGVPAGAVEAGGDLRVFGPAPQLVYVRDPGEPSRLLPLLELRDAAVATSAFGATGRQAPERAMSPIIDPRRGRPTRRRGSVSVAARTCALADGLTKLVALDGPRALPLLRRFRASAAIVSPGGRVRRVGGPDAA